MSKRIAFGRFSSFTFAWLCLLLLVSGCALSEEPPIVRTVALPTVTPTVPPDAGRPVGRVNLARGAEIFTGTQGCHLCHGLSGNGNGPAAQAISCPMVSFRDADANQSKALTAWFALVTNGNNGVQTCLMPPWKNVLDEQARWEVTSYAYSLHYTREQIERGRGVWAAQCASCHGERGATGQPDLSDPATLITRSDTQLFRLLVDGLPDGTHQFAALDEADQRAVVAYTRSLGWDQTEVIGVNFAQITPTPAPTVVAAIPDAPTLTVSGVVRNGTQGGGVPVGQTLTLRIIESTAQGFRDVLSQPVTTGSAGGFVLPDIPRRNGLFYVVSTTYAGVLQTSQPVQLQAGSGPSLDLSFTVYEPTTDAGAIRVERQRLFIDFLSPTVALIQQGILFQNTGDRVYIGASGVVGGVTLQVPLPEAASNITLSQNSGGFRIGNGAIIEAVTPILPGEVGLQFSYQLNFQGNLSVTQATRYLLAELTVHVPQGGGAFIADPGFSRDEPLILEAAVYDTYPLRRIIAAGEPITFTVRFGTPEEARRGLVFGAVGVGVGLLALMALAIWRLNRGEG
jgi:mono/diheme cytochrome c family protein